MLGDTQVFEVDYNDRDREGRLMASLRFASTPRIPDPGDAVWTSDDEGNGCWGIVTDVDGLIVRINLDRATWTRSVDIVSPFQTPVGAGDEDEARVVGYGLELV